jgi:hypothetical protein
MFFVRGFAKTAAPLGDNAFIGDTGGKSDIADTTATQLKWETSSGASPENIGYNEPEDLNTRKKIRSLFRKPRRLVR